MSALVLLFVPLLAGFDDFREEVFVCEESLAHLAQCCPSFDARAIDCHYDHQSDGCGHQTNHDPALSEAESTCIRAMSCGDLVAKGVCARAQAATPYTTRGGGDLRIEEAGHAPVCP